MRQQRIIISIIHRSKLTHPTNSYLSFCALSSSLIKLYSSTKLFFPQNNPAAIPPEKLKTMLQLIAFEFPGHGKMDKLANLDKMTDVVVSHYPCLSR